MTDEFDWEAFCDQETSNRRGDCLDAAGAIYDALELSQDRVVDQGIVKLLEEARDAVNKILFYETKAEREAIAERVRTGDVPF